jgi:hypothetical protein
MKGTNQTSIQYELSENGDKINEGSLVNFFEFLEGFLCDWGMGSSFISLGLMQPERRGGTVDVSGDS